MATTTQPWNDSGPATTEEVNENMWSKLNHFVLSLVTRAQVGREEGQALVEYTLILALVSVVAIALLTTIGNDVKTTLESVVNALKAA